MPRVRLPGGQSFKCEFLTTASSWRYQHTTTPEHGEATKLVLEAAVCEVCDETAWVSTIALKREIVACSAAVVPWMNPSGGIHLLREPDEGKEHEKSSMTPKAVARGGLKYFSWTCGEHPGIKLYLCPQCSYPCRIPADARGNSRFRCAMPQRYLECSFVTTASQWRSSSRITTPKHELATKLVVEAAVGEVKAARASKTLDETFLTL